MTFYRERVLCLLRPFAGLGSRTGCGSTALPTHTTGTARLCLQQGFATSMEAQRYKPHASRQGETIMSFPDTVTALTRRDGISGFPEGRAFSAVFIFAEWQVWHAGAVSWCPAVTGLSRSERADNTWHWNKTSALLSNHRASFFKAACAGNSYRGWQKPGLPKTTSQLGEVSGKIFLKFWTSSVSEVQLLWKTDCTEDWFLLRTHTQRTLHSSSVAKRQSRACTAV